MAESVTFQNRDVFWRGCRITLGGLVWIAVTSFQTMIATGPKTGVFYYRMIHSLRKKKKWKMVGSFHEVSTNGVSSNARDIKKLLNGPPPIGSLIAGLEIEEFKKTYFPGYQKENWMSYLAGKTTKDGKSLTRMGYGMMEIHGLEFEMWIDGFCLQSKGVAGMRSGMLTILGEIELAKSLSNRRAEPWHERIKYRFLEIPNSGSYAEFIGTGRRKPFHA